MCEVKTPTVTFLDPAEPEIKEPPPPQKTSKTYRVSAELPERFEHPDCFQGYSSRPTNQLYRTSNQSYGSRAPTVHEMPTVYHGRSWNFTKKMMKTGMYRDNGFNMGSEKTFVTGLEDKLTFQDRLNFQKSYLLSGPPHTE
ncbi:UPF0691 protein C9orf116 homolog [Callorhinchus milii]|uniref:Uncharacterized protein n=1 Tax=Callorhinchus milii TaxID=7868 RepID=A0A4W3GE99_CALMI|nr:UPF0691 protein C9orf116 homolog [Callorhinchus milii]|eukprot:gi/632969392/ref/XP_007901063.1/ PREDICTED: UPF0691 protein C9orf116 homolog [Callorhinchus milii]